MHMYFLKSYWVALDGMLSRIMINLVALDGMLRAFHWVAL
jgi:hypothetical protein